MEDQEIVELYFRRDEDAIRQTELAYGGKLYNLSYRLLWNREDAEESVSDTYLSAWNSIPPTRPAFLAAFLAKITRNLSIDRWRRRSAYKRTGGQMAFALEELGEIADRGETPEDTVGRKELVAAVNRFLQALPQRERSVFLCRYWYLDSLEDIAAKTGLTKGHISTMLHRTRKRLCICLQKEGLL